MNLWNRFVSFLTALLGWMTKTRARLAADTSGEINIVAMVLIIIVVIALVAIFRSEMTDIVTKMFEKIRSGMEV
ncbi:MAG: hypothetical protein J6T14_01845 [Clostridia bacterium]|nr:hypothetical protein [Clostridia bacterium]MBO7689570.1 hypothetical protein [Clostridia bacterium]MBP5272834.1 hypothetical protein [Clostridia bacterium]MBP5459981.1 hypothetical protein [Clostridia bacterium]